MKDLLKRCTIAVTGDFGAARSFEKIRQWIQVNGGNFSYDITPQVTHLICSKDHFRKSVTMVRAACRQGNAYIVTFDWLEDSLMKQRVYKEGEYLLNKNQQTHAQRTAKKKAVRERNILKGLQKFEQGCKDFENEMHSNGYHIYVDHTGYSYDITLVRADLSINQNERHVLKLYESHAIPKLYACFERHTSPGAKVTSQVLAPIGSSFDVAFDHFKKFFKLKTAIEWDCRLEMRPPEDCFNFIPPNQGEPKGVGAEQMQQTGGLENQADGVQSNGNDREKAA